MKLFYYPLLGLILISACRSPEKLLEKGKYDLIIKRAANVFNRRKSNPYKWVVAIEQAYVMANANEWAFIREKEKEGGLAAWKSVYYTALKVEKRQNKVADLLPVVADNGYTAKFDFSDVRTIIEKARNQIADEYYQLAKNKMRLVRSGSKQAALSSIRLIDSAMAWIPELDGIHELRKEAVDSAIVRVGVYVEGVEDWHHAVSTIEGNLQKELEYFYRQYLKIKLNPSREFKADYYLFLKPLSVYVGPDEEWSSSESFSKEIVTGSRTEKEWNETDSVWVTKTIEIKETVCATVTRYYQSKEAEMTAELTVEDPDYYRVFTRKKLYASDYFDNEYASVSGDERAIDGCVFTGFCDFFPSDWSMKNNMYHSISAKVRRYIKRYNWWPE